MWGLPGQGLKGRVKRVIWWVIFIAYICVLRTPLSPSPNVLPALLPQAKVSPQKLPRSNALPIAWFILLVIPKVNAIIPQVLPLMVNAINSLTLA